MKPYLIAAGNILLICLQYLALALLFIGAVVLGILQAAAGKGQR